MTRKQFEALTGIEQMTLFINWCKQNTKDPKKYTSLQEFFAIFTEKEVR